MAFLRIGDRRGQNIGHAQLAEPVMHFEPGVDRAGHGDRHRAERRDGLAALELLDELLVAGSHRAFSGAVQAIEFLRLRVPDDCEQIAADAVAGRLHQAKRGIGRNRGIDRRAAFFQYVDSDLAGQRMGCRRHAMPGMNRAARPGLSDRSPAAADVQCRFVRLCFLRLGRGQGQCDHRERGE